jgi:hypothetical protein
MMDKLSTIIVLGIIVAITLPFLIMSFIKKQKDIKFLKHFMSLAHKEKINISRREFWNHNYAIAIDNNSKKMIYANRLKDQASGTIIDLNGVENCRKVIVNKTQKNQNGNNPLSDRMELVFTFRNPELPEKVLEFYENSEFMPNSEECSHLENWHQIINSNLKQSN